MRKARVKTWTGPTMVDQVADWVEQAGIQVDVRGTEHIYFDVPSELIGSDRFATIWNLAAHFRTKLPDVHAGGWIVTYESWKTTIRQEEEG